LGYLKIGLAELDELLGEGIHEGSVILLFGDVGSGADLFAQQILYNQAKNGTRCAYFAVEKSVDDVRLDMTAFGFDPSLFEKKGYCDFTLLSESISLNSLQKILVDSMSGEKWIFVDSLSPIILRNDLQQITDLLKEVKKSARKYGGLHFIHVIRGLHESQVETLLKYLADGVFEFEFRSTARGVSRTLTISKLRGTALEIEIISYKITSRGIVIETATRIV